MLVLQRGNCKAGAVVELVVGVAAESTASRRAGGREGSIAVADSTHDSMLGRAQLLP